jgi:hypothetical protein
MGKVVNKITFITTCASSGCEPLYAARQKYFSYARIHLMTHIVKQVAQQASVALGCLSRTSSTKMLQVQVQLNY